MAGLANPVQTFLGAWSAVLTTRAGLKLHVRPAAREDEAAVRAFFGALGHDDLRFRFLSPLPRLDDSLYDLLINVDHVRTEDFLAFIDKDGEQHLVASAMLSCDPGTKQAEVAISVLPACRHKGIGYTLLDFASREAEQRGMELLQSIECRDNQGALEVEKDLGFTVDFCPDDPSLNLVSKRLDGR